ncbi:5-guanidino-2-oxopentanoate decarboxylase [Thiofilum flexile]|uniref:5-guanidino-2-oxopentanoate decarboxylase n=1 Tax=Thiofilum flexile TaxID=125627 RepID=UPI000372B720|nr:5-guanidino-2-oxopentanoate decarboxylase [Thiofilum flexile]
MPNSVAKTCGEYLVELLEAYGVDTVFGIPGVHTVELYRGLPATSIKHITPRHEQGAGFMADGYARTTGKIAACFIITGPGMTNIATAMGQAYADSIPMLVISAVNARHELALGTGRLHELPSQRNLVAGVSAFSHTLLRPDELNEVMARAFAIFNSARPRPVHIELPLDVITASAAHLTLPIITKSSRPAPSNGAIHQAAQLLAQAKKPLLVFGGGAAHAAKAAQLLTERLGALTVTTINGKGILPPAHPLSLGSTLPQKPVLDLLRDADVVLAVGTELGETDTLLFDGKPDIRGKLIRIDLDPEQLYRNAIPTLAITSDAQSALEALLVALDNHQPLTHTTTQAQQLRQQLQALLSPTQLAHQRVIAQLRAVKPATIIVGDQNQPVYTGNLTDEPDTTHAWFNSSTGYGTLGYALPAAIGAKIAHPERAVISLIGDGGLQFTLPELATAVEQGLALPIVVWNNHCYGEIKRYMQERDIPTIGVDIYTPDLLTIARGYGCHAVRANSLNDLQLQLEQAYQATKPTLIEINEAEALQW